MCFGGDGGAGDIAKQQRADEVARQGRIKAGMASIANIFDGTPSGDWTGYAAANPDVGTEWENKVKPTGAFASLDDFAKYHFDTYGRAEGRSVPGGITGGFNDAFYNKRAADYVAYATPDMEKQAKRAHENLIYALSRTGNLDSSAAIRQNSDLTDAENAERINIANTGQNQANTLRSQVEGARSNVVAELNATGDASAASAAALRNVANLNQPTGPSPLGELFSTFARTAAGIGSNASNGYGGFAGNTGGGLFKTGSGSQRVVN